MCSLRLDVRRVEALFIDQAGIEIVRVHTSTVMSAPTRQIDYAVHLVVDDCSTYVWTIARLGMP